MMGCFGADTYGHNVVNTLAVDPVFDQKSYIAVTDAAFADVDLADFKWLTGVTHYLLPLISLQR